MPLLLSFSLTDFIPSRPFSVPKTQFHMIAGTVGDWQILIRIYNQIELAYIAFKYISINNIDI